LAARLQEGDELAWLEPGLHPGATGGLHCGGLVMPMIRVALT
jgi:hypothetical protein